MSLVAPFLGHGVYVESTRVAFGQQLHMQLSLSSAINLIMFAGFADYSRDL